MQAARKWTRASPKIPVWSPFLRQQKSRYVSSIPRPFHKSENDITDYHQGKGTFKEKLYSDGRKKIQKEYGNGSKHLTLRERQSTLDDQEVIIPHSLEQTLRAHQKANQESVLIRRVNHGSVFDEKTTHSKRRGNSIPTESLHLDLEREDVEEGTGQWTDYQGKIRPIALDFQMIGDLPLKLKSPWYSYLNQWENSRDLATTRLTNEIGAADAFFSLNLEELKTAGRIVKELERSILSIHPSLVKLDVIGSRASGIATPLSDLDLNLVVEENTEGPARNHQLNILSRLYKALRWGKISRKTDNISVSYFVSRARIPIIVGRHASGLEFQIQNASSCYGSLEVVKSLCAEYPTLKALFKIIKQSLKMRSLADGHQGGLTSYPLINMITISLKHNAAKTDPFDSGKHLLQFLEYWSTIDLYKTGITHLPSKFLTSTEKKVENYFTEPETAANTIDLVTRDPVGARPIEFDVRKSLSELHEGQNNFMMTLHDPANPYNDLGRSAYTIKHIQATFMDMHSKLKKDISKWDAQIRANGDCGKSPPSLLRSLIEGDYTLYNMERKRISASSEFTDGWK